MQIFPMLTHYTIFLKSHLLIPPPIIRKVLNGDFCGGTVDKNLPASAGDMGGIPDQGTCHMGALAPQLLSPCA